MEQLSLLSLGIIIGILLSMLAIMAGKKDIKIPTFKKNEPAQIIKKHNDIDEWIK